MHPCATERRQFVLAIVALARQTVTDQLAQHSRKWISVRDDLHQVGESLGAHQGAADHPAFRHGGY